MSWLDRQHLSLMNNFTPITHQLLIQASFEVSIANGVTMYSKAVGAIVLTLIELPDNKYRVIINRTVNVGERLYIEQLQDICKALTGQELKLEIAKLNE